MREEGRFSLPRCTRVYQNHHLDSTRWLGFEPRSDDIVIATAYKAGTTWMQGIVSSLLFGAEPPGPVHELSPWIGMRVRPVDEILGVLEAQRHRRFIKSHLALDGLPFFPEAKYVYVGRDGRDVFMSLFNHYGHYTEAMRADLNGPGLVGDPQPPCPEDPRSLWRDWATRGWFAWEFDGWPYWSLLHHLRTWWEYRHLPNLLFVHFNDLLGDLSGEMRRVADFLEIPVAEQDWAARVELATFASMKSRAGQVAPTGGAAFEGGAERFMFKGTNGRWRGVLSEEDLTLWEQSVARQLSPACARWLEHGREGSELP